MALSIIDDKTGRTVREGDPDYDKVRANNLEATVADLMWAVADLQLRLEKIDGKPADWPGDTYDPAHRPPT